MFTDKKIIVVLEYIIGFGLLIAVLPLIVHPNVDWSDAYRWAYMLFIVSAGFTLISCASGMNQRMQLSKRISKLERTVEGLKTLKDKDVPVQTHSEVRQQSTAGEKFIASLN
ncbi:MAG: hypothetical protein ABII09_08960 [Planctomycetota bacterium]